MARVSREKISGDLLQSLFKQLSKSLSGLSVEKIDHLLLEFLGPEERIVLAKRLATIIMLHEGHTLYRVAKALKISTATAGKQRHELQKGKYKDFLPNLKKNQRQYLSILAMIDSILHLGGALPHYNSKDLYKHLHQNLSID